MSDYSQKDRRLKAAEQAANWLLTLQSAEVASSERAEFIDWLRESPLHVAELLHACRLQRGLSTFTQWHEIETVAGWQDNHVVSFLPIDERRRRPVALADRFLNRRVLIAAASVAVVGVLSALVAVRLGQIVISTQWGERREVTLADNSVVDLAPDSEVRVRLRPTARLVSLERGEALFHVAKNPKRPFIVTAANTSVRAVGTAFDVQRRARDVAVTVVEGSVSVTTQPSLGPKSRAGQATRPVPLSLGADEQVVISSSTGDAASVRQVQGEAEVAWATNQLEFDNEPVAEVVSRFNRYNHVQIRVLDRTLAQRRVSGTFRATDPESFVAFIQSVAGVTAVQRGGDVILLGPPSSGTQTGTPR